MRQPFVKNLGKAVNTSKSRLLKLADFQSNFDNTAPVSEFSQMLSITLGVTETMTVVAAKLQRLVRYSCCALFLQDEEQLLCRFVSGVDGQSIKNNPVLFEEQVKNWLAHIRPSTVAVEPHINTLTSNTFQSKLMITNEHESLIRCISPEISAIVANSLLFNKTQYESLSDPLTGLPNRRAFIRYLKETLSSAERMRSQLALFVIDLDHFKQINDRHGHLIGDQVLCDFAHMIGSIITPPHFCARYAGDEFILILSNCNNRTIQRIYRELNFGVESLLIETKSGTTITLKASTGIATFPADGNTYEQLFAAADGRMYKNKLDQHLTIKDIRSVLRAH